MLSIKLSFSWCVNPHIHIAILHISFKVPRVPLSIDKPAAHPSRITVLSSIVIHILGQQPPFLTFLKIILHPDTDSATQQIEDHPLVSFLPLDLASPDSLETVISHIDYTMQYGEDEEPKEVCFLFDSLFSFRCFVPYSSALAPLQLYQG